MYYGQKNYNQELGNGKFTIAQAGCLLVSVCNLRMQQGEPAVDPVAMNAWLLAHSDYLRDSDGALEDLAWDSITKYDTNFKVLREGTSAIPPNTPAIVKFYYQSVSEPWLDAAHTKPNMVTHFCIVSKIVNNVVYIIDSWDGLEKSPAQYQGSYHAPIGWATYSYTPSLAASAAAPTPPAPAPTVGSNTANLGNKKLFLPAAAGYWRVYALGGPYTTGHEIGKLWPGNPAWAPGLTYDILGVIANNIVKINTSSYGDVAIYVGPDTIAQFVTPPPAPPAAPVTIPYAGSGTPYTVVVPLRGYGNATQAGSQSDNVKYTTLEPGTYYVYRYYPNNNKLINISATKGSMGAWVNDDKNKVPTPPSAPAPVSDWPPTGVSGSLVSTPPPTSTAATAANGVAPKPAWQNTYEANPGTFFSNANVVVKDLSGTYPSVALSINEVVPIAGYFTGPDMVVYGRTISSVKNDKWYGIDKKYLDVARSNIITRKVLDNQKPLDHLAFFFDDIRNFFSKINIFKTKGK